MNFIAAFHWDSSKKSISYFAIDENYKVRISPQKIKFKKNDSLFSEIENTINGFFKEIERIFHGNPKASMSIEYRIVNHGNPAPNYNTKPNKPSDETQHVKDKFLNGIDRYSKSYFLKLSEKQYRSNLKNPVLAEFKAGIDFLIIKEKYNAYQYHLWALVLHATKSNYKSKIKKLKILRLEQEQQITEQKLRSA